MELVMVLEDDPLVRDLLRAIVERKGFSVAAAATAGEASALCKRRRGAIDLLIADVHLPTRSGAAAALEIRQSYPEVRILLTCRTPIEFWNDTERQDLAQLPRDCFSILQKPFTCWALAEQIDRLLPRFQLARTA